MSHLSPEVEQYIQSQLSSGAFKDRDDLLENALLLLKQQQEDRQYIHDAVNQGIEQAEKGQTVSGEEVLNRLERKVEAMADRPYRQ